jgi:predicted CXXCH cytochrome family protein
MAGTLVAQVVPDWFRMRASGVQPPSSIWPVWAAWLVLSVGASIAIGQSANNPHWSKDTCSTCHGTKPGPVAASLVTASCLSCHDGAHASDEAHPVGRSMNASLVDPGWPTVGGAIQCLTCHDVKMQCDPDAMRTEDNSSFLRQGSDADKPFCENCHRATQSTRLNPHLMVDAASHRPIAGQCNICHTKPMDATATTRTGNPLLRSDQITLCKSCHPHHKDISPTGHVLAKIPDTMLVYMRARELTGLLDSPSPDLIAELTAKSAKPQRMVPDSAGRVVCSTCHNPHQQGVFKPDCDLADRALHLVKGHLFTPTRGELFCRRCHKV